MTEIKTIISNYISLKVLRFIQHVSSVAVNELPDRRVYSSNSDMSRADTGSGNIQFNGGACFGVCVCFSVSLKSKPIFLASSSNFLS